MRLNIPSSDLAGALRAVRLGSPTADTPVRLDATDGALTLYAADATTAVRAVVPADVTEPGAAVLPARLLSQLVTGDAPASLDVDLSLATLSIDDVVSTLNPYDPASLTPPPWPQPEGFEVPRDDFLAAVDAVAPAVSNDVNRGAMTGVLLEASEGVFSLTATDSYRLITVSIPCPSDANLSAVVPAPALRALARVSAPVLRLGATDAEFIATSPELSVRTRLVAGAFPVWRGLLDIAGDNQITLPATELIGALTRVAPAAGPARVVTLDFTPEALTCSTRSDYGSAVATMTLAGPEISFAINVDFMIAALRVLSTSAPEVTLHYSEPRRPVLLTGDGAHRCLLMPLRGA